jgi:hypothetical protein
VTSLATLYVNQSTLIWLLVSMSYDILLANMVPSAAFYL